MAWQTVESAPESKTFVACWRNQSKGWNVMIAYRDANGKIREGSGLNVIPATHWVSFPSIAAAPARK